MAHNPFDWNHEGFAVYSAEKKTLKLMLCPAQSLEAFQKLKVHPDPTP